MTITKNYLRKVIKEALAEADEDPEAAAVAKSTLQQKAGGGEAIRTQVLSWMKPLAATPHWGKIKAAIEKGGAPAQLQAIDILLSGPESLVGLSPEAVKAFANQLSTAVKQG